MSTWSYARRLRKMYPEGRANAMARRYARLWAAVFALGLFPRRWVTLEVPGRRSGRRTRFPLGMADLNGQWYLVSMLGERCHWVQNVRAAQGHVVLRRRRVIAREVVEVPAAERAPVLNRYLQKVPGGRPHIPVSRQAPVGDFEAISARYPVFRVVPVPVPRSGAGARARARSVPVPGARKHRWVRRTLAGLVLVVAAIFALAAALIELQSVPAPLALPTALTAAPAGRLDGSWSAGPGSAAGFRVQENALGMSNDAVGRTSDVSGMILISDDQVSSAAFTVNLASIRVNGKPQAQFESSLDTRRYPDATVTLVTPIALDSAFAGGATVTATVNGQLTINGQRHPVAITVSGRRSGHTLQVAGSIPVAFATWHITGPAGYGFIASLADRGIAEFYLVLRVQSGK